VTHAPTLLVLSPSTGGYYFGAVLTGVAREVAAVGGRAVVVQTLEPGQRSDEIGEPSDFRHHVHWAEVDGVVSITSAVGAPYLSRLQDAGLPVAVASNQLPGLVAPSAMPDNHGGTVAAVEHLIAHGHTRIGFVGNLVQRDLRDRYDAYLQTLAAHGLVADPDHLYRAGDNGEPGGVQAAAAFLATRSRPTALMTATDRNAIGLMETLGAAGLTVPDDVALVSFDNIEAAAFTSPALTAVDQPFEEVGALAARLVLTRLAGADVPPTPHRSPATVVVRGSCGCLPEDPSAQAAATSRQETLGRLQRAVLTGRDATDRGSRHAVGLLLEHVDRLAAETAPHPADVDDVMTGIRRLAPRADVQRQVTRALDDYVRSTARPAAVPVLVAALRDLQAAAFLRQASTLELSLDEQFEVDSGLLDPEAADPRELSWLSGTHVRAAVLGLWDEEADGGLRMAGVYDPEGLVDPAARAVTSVDHFPPASLVQATRPGDREVCFVVPVRTRARDWGLLAVVATVCTSSARETYHHWAGLLAAALEQQALQAAVHTSEERYALAATAANDGLWEVDLRTRELYASDRCRVLLDLPATGPLSIDSWTGLVHPDDVDDLQLALALAASDAGVPVEHEFRMRGEDPQGRWALLRCLAVGSPGERSHRLVGSLADIGRRKELEERLRLAALYDPLTGLPNRRLFLDRLTLAVQAPSRRSGARFAVIFLDLDGFKLVNDSLGHLQGDELLKVVADRLRNDLRSVDTAARFGGDEFAVLLADPVPEEVLVIAHRIQDRLAEPVDLGGTEVSVTASIGIATSETGYDDPEDVLRDADIAMYDAKVSEPGSASLFDREMHTRATGRLRARVELRTALAERQFVVHYQPIVALDGTGVRQFEALVRWEHPVRGLLFPGDFLPAMSDNSTVVTLGHWIIDEVCRQLSVWRGGHDLPVTVAVNLSHHEFWCRDLSEVVADALLRHDVPAECLVLEITESVVMTDLDAARVVMAGLRELGVRLHIDDFGTGQSSLHALRTFPVDALKIDGSFIRELGQVAQTTELVRIIVDMGKALGLDVVAECVETTEQAEHLQGLGCANAQGWLYARAMPGPEAGALLGRSLALTLR
jgi:diguanylate cyclase (GGDEF)-like protein